jgi:predicted nucleic acid-binding protein
VYFDSSALVKLLVHEEGSSWCEGIWDDASEPFTCAAAYVEVRAALAAAHRDGRLTPANFRSTKARFESIWSEIGVLDFDAALIQHAGDVAEVAALRGYDAIHLSSAQAIHAAKPLYMLTWDKDLARASFDAGINVIRSTGT